jgi:energy-coupling factor transporter ATP-binding protein EcfA2
MTIDAITLEWFRGAADSITLDSRGRSVVVYGPNGSGKSSFVDGVEFIASGGKVGHLSHEYSGKKLEKSIINTHITDGSSSVRIKIRDVDICASIRSDGKVTFSNLEALASWDLKRIVLRQEDVSNFINSNKSTKYSAVLPLLGLGSFDATAQNIRAIARKVRDEVRLDHAKGQVDQIRKRLNAAYGSDEWSKISSSVQDLHQIYFPDAEKPASLRAALSALSNEIAKRVGELDAEKACLLALKNACDADLAEAVTRAVSADARIAGYAEPFLKERLAVLRAAAPFSANLKSDNPIHCPACGSDISSVDFDAHVTSELSRLEVAANAFDARRKAYHMLADALSHFKAALSSPSVKAWRSHHDQKELTSQVDAILAFDQGDLLDENRAPDLAPLLANVPFLCSRVNEAAKRTAPSVDQLFREQNMIEAAAAIPELRALESRINKTEPLLSFLRQFESEIRKEVNGRTQTLVDELSANVQRIWAQFHPGEPIDEVKLCLGDDDDKAIDVGLRFHGKEQASPRLTLSEGHRNSLGLAIFLAFAKRARPEHPLILDDVVTSFDREHRCFVANVLINEFSDRQVFIFTHDDQWFTELRYRLPHDRWAFKTLIPWRSPALGSAWDARGEDFGVARALLEGDPSAAANKARGLMDVHMAVIAELLEVPVPHVRGSRNELRNALDLLQRFRSRANDKLRRCDPDGSYKKWQIPIDAAHAAATLLVPWGNSASHGRRVARSEAEQLINQCEAVISALACGACKTPVWHAKVANQHLRCSCDAVRWLS